MKFKLGDVVRPKYDAYKDFRAIVKDLDFKVKGVFVQFNKPVSAYHDGNPDKVFKAIEGWVHEDELILIESSDWESLWDMGEE